MLYSESKERGNRFLIALKIAFPFLILIIYLIYTFNTNKNSVSIILVTILIPIYTYYIFYLIYNGFKSTLIDKITKTFNRKEILEFIQKETLKDQNSIIVLVSIENIYDIDERYGVNNADNLLMEFAKRLNTFLENYNFKNIPIGRYSGGSFLLIIKHKKKELKHLMTIFSKELKNIGINDIEVKVDFSLIESNYDSRVENIIKILFDLIDEERQNEFEIQNIKPNEFEKIIYDAVADEKFLLKYQPSLNLITKEIEIYEILVKIYSKNYGLISKNQAQKAINFGGFEKIFDKKIFDYFLKELKYLKSNNDKKRYFSINVSAVSLRDNDFRLYLREIFYKNNIKIENIILEINEKKAYKDLKRFAEILTQYKKAGFKIALDNFGGDNCSIKYLKNLPIDFVKFDIQYTKYFQNEKYKKTLKNLLNLCKDLDVKTMIKFIDKQRLYEQVIELNPAYIQGFYISKPKSIKQL
ncbi:MAG: GGDEF domain-containing protein [Sulfurospirillum sp.]